MSYFTSLLNGDVYDIEDDDSSQIPPQIPTFSTQEPTQHKKGRANNFTIEEDTLLLYAWQNISMDPIKGSNQTHQTYWDRIAAYYDENKTFSTDRTSYSLSHRWSFINTSVSKFIGYYNQIQERNPSGANEKDKEGEAMAMYLRLQKRAFQLLHCWNILRNCPKFAATIQKKTQKNGNDSPKSSASAESPFNSKVSQDNEPMERPMGRKAAKRLKITENDATGNGLITSINQAKDIISKQSESRNSTIQQLIELEKEMLRATKERERAREERERIREERENRMYEISILGIDTSTMEAPLAEYYKSLKAEILKKRI